MVVCSALVGALSVGALHDGAWTAAAMLAAMAGLLTARIARECALATAALLAPIDALAMNHRDAPSAAAAPAITASEPAFEPVGVVAR
jgi:hypothetical protein